MTINSMLKNIKSRELTVYKLLIADEGGSEPYLAIIGESRASGDTLEEAVERVKRAHGEKVRYLKGEVPLFYSAQTTWKIVGNELHLNQRDIDNPEHSINTGVYIKL